MVECNAENWAGLSTTRCAEPHPPPVVDAGSLSRAASMAEPELSLTAYKNREIDCHNTTSIKQQQYTTSQQLLISVIGLVSSLIIILLFDTDYSIEIMIKMSTTRL